MPKFEIRNTSHIGGLQLKKILEQAVLSRQTNAKIGEPGERATRKKFLESRARIEVPVDVDEERLAEWVDARFAFCMVMSLRTTSCSASR